MGKRCPFKPKAIAVAVALALSNAGYADWGPTVEGFVKPGNKRSLAGVEALLPIRQDGNGLLFADIKGHLESDDSNEFNLGLGHRQLTGDGKWALGLYGAWDHRRSDLGNRYNQLTVGAEARGEKYDLRLNYYHPITNKKLQGLGAPQFAGFGVFRNGIYEEAMHGFDVEAGMLLPVSERVETRLYLAGYSFKGADVAPEANGARLRVEARVNQNMAFGASTQHDKVFGTANYVEFRYTFGKTPKPSNRTVTERMAEPWTRDIDVVVSKPTESTNLGDAQQTPDSAVHVNSAAAAGGDGSFEHPYNSVAACEAAKCFENAAGVGSYNLIRLWQGSSLATPYTRFNGLKDGQTLWGQGIDIYSGRVQAGLYPVIDSSGGAGVTLYSGGTLGNSVKGVSISGSGNGIVGNNTWGTVNIQGNNINMAGVGIGLSNSISNATPRTQNVSIANNTITSVSGEGAAISLINRVSGADTGLLTQTAMINDNTISSSAYGGGIDLSNYAGYGGAITQTATISGNTITAAYGGAIGIALDNAAYYDDSVAIQTVTISGNTITAGGTGIRASNNAEAYYTTNTATQTLTISGNTINAGSDGIVLQNQASSYFKYEPATATQTATISGNTLSTTNGGMGMTFDNWDDGYHDAVQTVTVSGSNTVTGFAVGIYARNNTDVAASAQAVTVSGATITSTQVGAVGVGKCNVAGNQTVTLGSGITLNGATQTVAVDQCAID